MAGQFTLDELIAHIESGQLNEDAELYLTRIDEARQRGIETKFQGYIKEVAEGQRDYSSTVAFVRKYGLDQSRLEVARQAGLEVRANRYSTRRFNSHLEKLGRGRPEAYQPALKIAGSNPELIEQVNRARMEGIEATYNAQLEKLAEGYLGKLQKTKKYASTNGLDQARIDEAVQNGMPHYLEMLARGQDIALQTRRLKAGSHAPRVLEDTAPAPNVKPQEATPTPEGYLSRIISAIRNYVGRR